MRRLIKISVLLQATKYMSKLALESKCSKVIVRTGNLTIDETDHEQLLGITFDRKLCVKQHVEVLCKHTNQTLLALARLSTYTDPIKFEMLINSVIKSKLDHCPLIWMFHDRMFNSKTNLTHERASRLVCKDSETEFEKLIKTTSTTQYASSCIL